jgi:hypothetical protein
LSNKWGAVHLPQASLSGKIIHFFVQGADILFQSCILADPDGDICGYAAEVIS